MDENDDLRATIESAFDADADADADAGSAPPGDTPELAPQGDAPEPAPRGEPAQPSPAPSGTVRDSLGRFVPKDASAAAPGSPQGPSQPDGGATPQPAPGEAPTAAPGAPTAPAPIGWNPAVRAEHWGRLPPAVQQEVLRREQAFDQAFRQTAQVREVGEGFMRAVQPFQMAIQAEGVDPITAVTNLMQVGSALRFGTPREKALTVAKLVQVYGVDIRGLDDALAGSAPTEGAADTTVVVQQAVQQALRPIMAAAQERHQQATQRVQVEARTELESFAADPAHEFYHDVRRDMADIIEVAGRQGRVMNLKEAYARACMLHPDVSRVMIARRQGVNAKELTQAARSARAAAVGVRGSAPVGNPGGNEPSSIRESIEAAIESHSRV